MEVTPFNFHEHLRIRFDVHEFLSTNFGCRRMTNQGLWEQNCCERRSASGNYARKANVRGSDEGDKELHDLGQSLWLDNITRDLLDNGTLKRYIDELSVTGLTSNPTIFEHAISKSKSYDAEIGRLLSKVVIRRGIVLRTGAAGSDSSRRPLCLGSRTYGRQ